MLEGIENIRVSLLWLAVELGVVHCVPMDVLVFCVPLSVVITVPFTVVTTLVASVVTELLNTVVTVFSLDVVPPVPFSVV